MAKARKLSGKRKSKTWMSESAGNSPRLVFPWWKSPLMKAERLRRAATRRVA